MSFIVCDGYKGTLTRIFYLYVVLVPLSCRVHQTIVVFVALSLQHRKSVDALLDTLVRLRYIPIVLSQHGIDALTTTLTEPHADTDSA
jgi:hypothetical protein